MFSANFYTDLLQVFESYYDKLIDLLPKLMIALLLYIILYFLSILVERVLRKWLKRSLEDQLLVKFISKVVKMIIIISAILMSLKIAGMGSLVTGILGTAGVGAFVLGFAFKDIGEHFLAGILLAFNRPFRVGDTVELNNVKGVVQSLSLRTTQIKSFDGQDIFIPNGSIVKNNVINYTLDGFYRYDFNVILDNHVDLTRTSEIIIDQLKTVEGILFDEKKPTIMVSINEVNSLVFNVLYWLNTDNKAISIAKVKNEAIHAVKKGLLVNGYKLGGNSIEVFHANNPQE